MCYNLDISVFKEPLDNIGDHVWGHVSYSYSSLSKDDSHDKALPSTGYKTHTSYAFKNVSLAYYNILQVSILKGLLHHIILIFHVKTADTAKTFLYACKMWIFN